MRRFVHVRRQLTPLPLRTIGRSLARRLVPWGTAGGRGAELETLTRATFHLFINALLSERGSERLSFITLFIYFFGTREGLWAEEPAQSVCHSYGTAVLRFCPKCWIIDAPSYPLLFMYGVFAYARQRSDRSSSSSRRIV